MRVQWSPSAEFSLASAGRTGWRTAFHRPLSRRADSSEKLDRELVRFAAGESLQQQRHWRFADCREREAQLFRKSEILFSIGNKTGGEEPSQDGRGRFCGGPDAPKGFDQRVKIPWPITRGIKLGDERRHGNFGIRSNPPQNLNEPYLAGLRFVCEASGQLRDRGPPDSGQGLSNLKGLRRSGEPAEKDWNCVLSRGTDFSRAR